MRTVFRGGTVFDGTGAPLGPADVAIEGERIVDVGPGLDGDTSVDVSGRTILPGLFDCHTHVVISSFDLIRNLERPFSYQFFEAARNLVATLQVGITTIRDASGADLGVKQAVADGLIRGPRMQIAVNMLSQTGGHNDTWMPCGAAAEYLPVHPGRPGGIADGPVGVRIAVRERVRAGADVIKIAASGGVLSPRSKPQIPQFSPDELEAIVAEATAAGIPVMAHAQAAEGIKNAVRAGVRSIEHGIFLDDEGIELMIRNGTFLVPTLVAVQGLIDSAAAGAAVPAASIAKAHAVRDIHRTNVRRAIEAGVRVAMGTDSSVSPHGRNLEELGLLVEAGMRPIDALVAATRTAAECLRVEDDLGSIEPGKRADLVIVAGDPLAFAGLDTRIEAVWKDGRLEVERGRLVA